MCGLAGLFLPAGYAADALEERVRKMTSAITHRGPDDQGIWTEPSAGLALGFRRLSIIDLSPAGHQPMASPSGRFTAVFNGEIYNHRALRTELERNGFRFRGHSDTEVMLAAFEQWGIPETLPRLMGMFAIAAWDATDRTLTLVRDRVGKKPLFYWHDPQAGLLFGSELKALCAEPRFPRRLDVDSLALYFRYLYVPSPKSIFRDTWKLPPGHLLTIRSPTAPLPAPECYWRLTDQPDVEALGADGDEAGRLTDELELLLRDAVRLRLESDVPLGALLSGGVDSSTIVALMQSQSSQPVRTYTIGFDVAAHDESRQAAAVAKHIGTEHTALHVSGREALDLVPSLPDFFDEPLADPSAIPTYLVCRLARREVTVALTGDGGDEVFGGYNRYIHGARVIRRLASLPAPARLAAAAVLGGVSAPTWDRVYHGFGRVLPGKHQQRFAGEKLHKLGALLCQPTAALQYRSLLSAWQEPESLLRPSVEGDANSFSALFGARGSLTLEEQMMLADQGHYLPDDLLAKVDRASMAVSLEARVPLLDHRIVEFGWRLPLRYKVRGSKGKWLLREVLHRHVPRELVERPKVGFSVPIAEWLRGPLRPWAEHLLSTLGEGEGEVLHGAVVRKAWEDLRSGARPTGLALWTVLGFLAWRERWQAQP